MSDRKLRSAWPWFAGLLLVLVLYVASVGPAYKPMMEHPEWQDAIVTFYAPLGWITEHSDAADALLCKYVSYWCGKRIPTNKELREEQGQLLW